MHSAALTTNIFLQTKVTLIKRFAANYKIVIPNMLGLHVRNLVKEKEIKYGLLIKQFYYFDRFDVGFVNGRENQVYRFHYKQPSSI